MNENKLAEAVRGQFTPESNLGPAFHACMVEYVNNIEKYGIPDEDLQKFIQFTYLWHNEMQENGVGEDVKV